MMFAGSIDKSDFPRFAHRGHPCALICRPGKRSCWKPLPSALFSLSVSGPPPPIAWSPCLIHFVSLRSPHFPFQPSTSPDQWIVRFQLSVHTPLADTPVTSESAPPGTPPPLSPIGFPSSEKPKGQHQQPGFVSPTLPNRLQGSSFNVLTHDQPLDCFASPHKPSWIFSSLMPQNLPESGLPFACSLCFLELVLQGVTGVRELLDRMELFSTSSCC